MDTRHKIVTVEEARRAAKDCRAVAVVTHLEVLSAEHLKVFTDAAEPGTKLFVILTDTESPLVPMEARAEMAAALRVVDYVVPSAMGAEPALRAIGPWRTIDDQEDDRERTRQLTAHVRSRSGN